MGRTSGLSMKKLDRLSKLSDDILCRVLSELPTKDSIRTSLLSKQWRNIWLNVPALDLDSRNFEDDYEFLDFIDRFLESNKVGDIKRFKLIYDAADHCDSGFVSRIDGVVKRGVCHLTVLNQTDSDQALVSMPFSLYSCETLVNLTLYCVVFNGPEDLKSELVVSLPCLKKMHLEGVKFDGVSILGTLISGCLALEELIIVTHPDDYLEVVCVRSQSLKSFKLETRREESEDPNVEVDSPGLEYMSISDYGCESLVIHRIGPSAKVNIDVMFDVEYDERMIHDFLTGISTVREMIISARTLEAIHIFSQLQPLPQFDNLYRLDASFSESTLEFLPTFIGCCPNLQSIIMEFDCPPETKEIKLSYVPQCFSSSLEFVQLKTPVTITEPSMKMNLAKYFMRNCAVLKKLVVSKSFNSIISKIRRIPKRSRGSEVVMLERDYEVVSQKTSLLTGCVAIVDDSGPF